MTTRELGAHLGARRVDLLIENLRITDLVRQRLYHGWIAVLGGRFVYVEEGDAPAENILSTKARFDAEGMVAQPGLIDTHMHIESSLVTPRRFAEGALPWGTTTILQDPHEVANILGAAGVRWMIEACRDLPLRIYSAISSCVPATADDVETPNATLTAEDVTELAQFEEVLALGEMMDYQGLVSGSERLVKILRAASAAGLSLEGHVPSLKGRALSDYVACGIRSDHTLATPEKVAEQLSKGLFVMLQEKSLTPEVISFVRELPDRSRILLITDDVMPNRLLTGHLNRIVELATEQGWPVMDALASASLRPAGYLGQSDLGLIAPGQRADFLLGAELNDFPPKRVYVEGALVAQDGQVTFDTRPPHAPPEHTGDPFTIRPSPPMTSVPEAHFNLTQAPGETRLRARVIKVNNTNTFTTLEERDIQVVDGTPAQSEALSLAVVIPRTSLDQARQPGGRVCLIAGLGLRRGAFASSFSHDSHNVFVVGAEPASMQRAVQALTDSGGGMAVASQDTVQTLPLPLSGLLSDAPIAEVAEQFGALEEALRELGMQHRNPVLLLTILPLSVSPNYKVSDLGIVDVEARRILDPLVTTSATS